MAYCVAICSATLIQNQPNIFHLFKFTIPKTVWSFPTRNKQPFKDTESKINNFRRPNLQNSHNKFKERRLKIDKPEGYREREHLISKLSSFRLRAQKGKFQSEQLMDKENFPRFNWGPIQKAAALCQEINCNSFGIQWGLCAEAHCSVLIGFVSLGDAAIWRGLVAFLEDFVRVATLKEFCVWVCLFVWEKSFNC